MVWQEQAMHVSDLTLEEMYIVQKVTAWVHWKSILKGAQIPKALSETTSLRENG